MLGHADRRALKDRTMPRAQWNSLVSQLRKAARAGAHAKRAETLARELTRLTGCEIGRFYDRRPVPFDQFRPWETGFADKTGRLMTVFELRRHYYRNTF